MFVSPFCGNRSTVSSVSGRRQGTLDRTVEIPQSGRKWFDYGKQTSGRSLRAVIANDQCGLGFESVRRHGQIGWRRTTDDATGIVVHREVAGADETAVRPAADQALSLIDILVGYAAEMRAIAVHHEEIQPSATVVDFDILGLRIDGDRRAERLGPLAGKEIPEERHRGYGHRDTTDQGRQSGQERASIRCLPLLGLSLYSGASGSPITNLPICANGISLR